MGTRTCNVQAAAIPCRVSARGGIQVLLITTGAGRWGVPKGYVEAGETAPETAAREALEEAGVTGAIVTPALGEFGYERGGEEHRCTVFALRVDEVHADWSERHERRRAWVTLSEARRLIGRAELRKLLRLVDANTLVSVVLRERGLREAV